MQEKLRECHRLGYLTNEFATMAMDIAKKRINNHKNQNIPYSAREEAFSIFCFKLTTKWEKIDPEKYPGSYLNFMAHNCLMDVLRVFNRDLKRIDSIKDKNNIEKETNNILYTPTNLDLRTLSRQERAVIKKHVIKLLNKGISKYEIERKTGIKKLTLIKWHKKHKEIGQKFYQLDKRESKKK